MKHLIYVIPLTVAAGNLAFFMFATYYWIFAGAPIMTDEQAGVLFFLTILFACLGMIAAASIHSYNL